MVLERLLEAAAHLAEGRGVKPEQVLGLPTPCSPSPSRRSAGELDATVGGATTVEAHVVRQTIEVVGEDERQFLPRSTLRPPVLTNVLEPDRRDLHLALDPFPVRRA